MPQERVLMVTGHRPPKLGGFSNEVFEALTTLAKQQLGEVLRPDRVITGMALGWDQAVAAACVTLGIPFVAAVPFDGQDAMWPSESRDRWRSLCAAAERVEVVCPGPYAASKMQRRNEWGVDNSNHVLALWDGSAGGTRNCVDYARRVGRPITNCWPQWQLLRSPRNKR